MNGWKKSMSRREFLKKSAGVSAAVLFGETLTSCAAHNDYTNLVANIRSSKELSGSDLSETAVLLVNFAVLAANSHNSQPWKFTQENDHLYIHPDFSRSLSVVDPDHRELWISLGCALENMLISAEAFGLESEIKYPSSEEESIQISLRKNLEPLKNPLFSMIPIRQSNRSVYNEQKISLSEIEELQSVKEEIGINSQFLTEKEPRRLLNDLTEAGDMAQFADQKFLDELVSWIRFNKKEAVNSMDGLYSICSGNPEAPRWLGKLFLSSSKADSNAEQNRKKMESSAGLILISSEEDNIPAWIRSGRLYQRQALQMTLSGIQSALMNQALEIPHLRTRLAESLPSKYPYPQLLVRFGYADSMPYSLRRDITEVFRQE